MYGMNLTSIKDMKLGDHESDAEYQMNFSDDGLTSLEDSDASVNSAGSPLPDFKKVYLTTPRRQCSSASSLMEGSSMEDSLSFKEAKEIYQSIEPEYVVKPHKMNSSTSMESTQTVSDLFPEADGYLPEEYKIAPQSFEAFSFHSSTSASETSPSASDASLTSMNSEATAAVVVPKVVKIDGLVSDPSHTFSSVTDESSVSASASASASSYYLEDGSTMSDSSCCCLTAKSDVENGTESDVSVSSKYFEDVLHATPAKLVIESEKCMVFYLENHFDEELLISLDTLHGIDCTPTDMTIEGNKRKKIFVSTRKSMLPGTRTKILATFKFQTQSSRLKIPVTIV